ncbi:MAG TPA: T9SS type A sorting domain-containing protein [bacterium]|nr:T9SS type A sorting domain-containing protein [bacterium]
MRKKIISPIIYFSIALFSITINAEEHQYDNAVTYIKCGTPQIMESILLGTAKIAVRPTDIDATAVSSQNHFRVHYNTSGTDAPDLTDDNNNGIPDYVDSSLVYLEYAWDLMINQLGYPPPLSDEGKGGGDEVDVYLKNLSNSYGYAQPDKQLETSTSSYIVIENDFSESIFETHGYDALRVTTAHEFFHTIHFNYLTNWRNIHWWMEQTSTWMEDRAWDDVNDYLAYLHYFFNQFYPLDHNISYDSYMYGATLWVHYLAESFGDDIIKDIWEHLSYYETTDISAFDEVIPIGLSSAFAEFSVWNYFTEDRANTNDFYHDSDLFKESVKTDLSINKSTAMDTLYSKKLTSRYVEILFGEEWGENHALRAHVTPLNGGSFVNSVIFYNNPYDYRIHVVDPEGEDIPFEKYWEKAVLINSNVNTIDNTYRCIFETEIIEYITGIEEEPLYTFSIQGTYPNPFNPATTISFILPESGAVTVHVFNSLGQKVENLFDGHLDAGEKSIIWKPNNLSGGVYLINIKTSMGTKTTKTLYLK